MVNWWLISRFFTPMYTAFYFFTKLTIHCSFFRFSKLNLAHLQTPKGQNNPHQVNPHIVKPALRPKYNCNFSVLNAKSTMATLSFRSHLETYVIPLTFHTYVSQIANDNCEFLLVIKLSVQYIPHWIFVTFFFERLKLIDRLV